MKIKLIVLLLLFPVALFAQQRIDSLNGILRKTTNDIDRIAILNQIADEYKASDPKKMQVFALQALSLARKINDKAAEANALLNLGNSNVLLGNYPQALIYFSDARLIFEKENASEPKIALGLARVYGSLGIVFSEQSNYATALQFYLLAARVAEKSNDPARTARLYNNIGVVYQSLNDDFRALENFVKAEKIQLKINDRSAGFTATNIGNIYLRQKNYPKAIQSYTSAKNYFIQNPDPRGQGELANNLGLYYIAQNNDKLALQHYFNAIRYFGMIDDKFGVADTYLHLADLAVSQKKSAAALTYANQALALANELQVPDQIIRAEKMLSSLYESQNNPAKALLHFQRYSVARDSLAKNENIRKSVQAEMNFEYEKREALQQEQREKKELLYLEQSKRHLMQMAFSGLALLLTFGIILLIYSRRHLKKTLTLEKELAEYEQKALHLQMNPHFVFNCLGSISSFIVQNGSDSAIKYLSKFSKLMRLTLEYSKEPLIPIDKEIDGLRNYLELEQLRFNQKFDFEITKSTEIEDDMALPPLLLQPFVENAIIHGLIPKKEPGKIVLSFEVSGADLVCTIRDNGIGFNKSQEIKENLVSVHKSMALDITRKRLQMMEASTSKKAQVKIIENKSDTGEVTGTTVVLTLPIQYIKAG